MPAFETRGVRVVGITAAVPGPGCPVAAGGALGTGDLAKIIASTGVRARHVAPAQVCTSDLCHASAVRLLDALQWPRESIDLLVFVSQTPDQILPATACVLHGSLGLAKSCAAFDVNLGCSGYVYGLSIVSAHLQSGAGKRALLLVGDTISKVVSPKDRSVAYLFGDAGTATALERSETATPIHFLTGSDGTGARNLEIPAGMFRNPSSEETRAPTAREGGNSRSDEHLAMNGAEIFNFTIREVPSLITRTLECAGWPVGSVDYFVLHQANRFMLDYLAKRMKLPVEKVVLVLEQFGNTSSASIPLALCASLRQRLGRAPAKLVLTGFGVGFSWASAAVEFDSPHIEPVINLSV